MDPSVLLSSVIDGLSRLWWLFLLGFVVLCLRMPRTKGLIGELLVRMLTRLMLDRATYNAFHNVTLSTSSGTVQIDHVLVSRYGIFVVETKNLKGWIYGRERDARWTQKLGRKSCSFQNPLRQNYKHVAVIRELLNVPKESVYSIVVLTGSARLKNERPEHVLTLGSYIQYLRGFQTPVLTEEQVKRSCEKLGKARLAPTRATHKAHVKTLRRKDGRARGN